MPEREGPFIDNEALREIRQNTDWRRLFDVLGLVRDEKKSKADDWWALSPLGQETDASFHVNDRGWYDFGRGAGGGPIELVQAVLKVRGEVLNCYQAGAWLLDRGVSVLPESRTNASDAMPPAAAGPGAAEPDRVQETAIGEPEPGAAGRSEEETDPTPPENLDGGPEAPQEKKKGRRASPLLRVVTLPGAPETDNEVENRPIRQNLVPALSLQGEHPEFVRRGISKETCEYLGAGFLGNSRSSLQGRIVFQIRGLRVRRNDSLCTVILSHIGRATTPEQVERDGKWHLYAGYNKSRELYNLDGAVLDDESEEQIRASGRVLLVEGPFDVAKLLEAGVKNVVASLGSQLSPRQGELLVWMLRRLRMSAQPKVLVFYDRDDAGRQGAEKAVEVLKGLGLEAEPFGWEQTFASPRRPVIRIPDTVKDPGDFSAEQIRWLRERGAI